MSLRLVKPSPVLLMSYREACIETFEHVHNKYIIHDPALFNQWSSTVFDDYEKAERGIGLPDGYLPNAARWITDGTQYIGTVNIRLGLNEALADYGGHLGLVIRCSMRGKGFGRAAAVLGIAEAQRSGIDPVLVTCIESNTVSCRIFSGIPFIRSEYAVTMADGIMRPVWRFYYSVK